MGLRGGLSAAGGQDRDTMRDGFDRPVNILESAVERTDFAKKCVHLGL